MSSYDKALVALKTVSLNSPVVAQCPFYTTKASTLLEMDLFTGVL